MTVFDMRPSLEGRARAALAHSVEWRAGTYALTELNLGLSNQVFLATKGDERFVVRVFDAGTQTLSVDRATELTFGTLAARLGIGPKVIALNNQFSVSEFSQGRHPDEHELLVDATRERKQRKSSSTTGDVHRKPRCSIGSSATLGTTYKSSGSQGSSTTMGAYEMRW